MVQTERGCLVMTDLTGYTGYLTGAELGHAEGVLADLLETVIGTLRPMLTLAKLEGDAAFAYAVQGKIDGPMLLDVVEQCYFSFQRRRRDVRRATTCECNACAQIGSLNLKVFVHDGEFVRHRIAGREELAGADVILVHRLMKNTVSETFGLQGYALFTDACVRAAGIDAPGLGMRAHRETYEHIGEVQAFVHDLQTRWSDEQERRRVFIAPEKADGEISVDLSSPPALVWDYLTSPAKRLCWQPIDGLTEQNPHGRRGPGTTNHCAHGNEVIVEEVLDWRPFDYFTVRFVPMGFPIDETVELIPTDGGTRVTMRQKIPRGKKAREAWSTMRDQYGAMMRDAFAGLAALLAREARGDEAAARSRDRNSGNA